MWDVLVLTAGTEEQKADFQLLLDHIEGLKEFTHEVLVVSDEPSGVRIGSGGATILVIRKLKEKYGASVDDKRILVVHSGGLSQRMPHLSAFGKIFAVLPDRTTVLEKKLETYRKLSITLPAGLMVAASDVIEDTSHFAAAETSSDMILFANQSNVEVGKDHGVFVVDSAGELVKVLQKPTIAEMQESHALNSHGQVLTDCFYWMSWKLCTRLVEHCPSIPFDAEICCYGDFMRSLGKNPDLQYLKQGSDNLQRWRRCLSEVFRSSPVVLGHLGPNSFFHLGTTSEFIEHLQPQSIFTQKFLHNRKSTIYSNIGDVRLLEPCQIEFCHFSSGRIGKNCIISGCESIVSIDIPADRLVFTICTRYKAYKARDGYATIVIGTEDDVKTKRASIAVGPVQAKNCSLWDLQAFPFMPTREESIQATFSLLNGTDQTGCFELISIADAVKSKNLIEMVQWRNKLKETVLHSPE